MTSPPTPSAQAWSRIVAHAAMAPSVHNTQPWAFRVGGSNLGVYADRTRQLDVLDPDGRQLHISCGCAIFNARVALAAAGFRTVVARRPDALQPDLMARLTVTGRVADPTLVTLAEAVEQRHTNRRDFVDAVDPAVLDVLISAARSEGAELSVLTSDHDRETVARLTALAERTEVADRAYRAELRRWTTTDPMRPDGVPASAVPHVDVAPDVEGGASRPPDGDEAVLRDFDSAGIGWLPGSRTELGPATVLLLATATDGPVRWLRAGEALERVLLELTRRGYAASPLTQATELTHVRDALRDALGSSTYPQLLLRAGRAPAVSGTRRRALRDVVTIAR